MFLTFYAVVCPISCCKLSILILHFNKVNVFMYCIAGVSGLALPKLNFETE